MSLTSLVKWDNSSTYLSYRGVMKSRCDYMYMTQNIESTYGKDPKNVRYYIITKCITLCKHAYNN